MSLIEDSAESIIRSSGSELGPLEALYRDSRMQPPTVKLAPRHDEIPLATHRSLWQWWSAQADQDALPNMDLITPAALKPYLGRLILMEPIDGGADFRYRLYGSTIAHFVGNDFTGKLLSETYTHREFPEVAMSCHLATFRASIQARCPLYMAENRDHKVTPYTWHRLLLPFADAEGTVARVVLYTVPCDNNGAPMPAWRMTDA